MGSQRPKLKPVRGISYSDQSAMSSKGRGRERTTKRGRGVLVTAKEFMLKDGTGTNQGNVNVDAKMTRECVLL